MAQAAKASPVAGVGIDYRIVFDAVPGLYLLIDRDLNIVTANDAYCRATLTEQAAISGRPLFEVFPDNPGDPNADGVRNLRASLARVMATKVPDEMPIQKYDVRGADGKFEERHWSVSNTPVLGPDGGVALIIHRASDVSHIVRLQKEGVASAELMRGQVKVIDELRRALEENARLAASHRYLASIVESSNDPIIALTMEGVITGWNKAAENLFGYSAAEITGRHITLLLPVDRVDEEQKLIARIARGEIVRHYKTQRRAKNGALKDVSISLSPIRDTAGTIIGASKIMEDITQQLMAEHKLRRLEADRSYLADVVESSNDAIIARSLDGMVVSWNKAAARMFGYTAAEIIGLPAARLVPPDRQGETERMFKKIKPGDASVHFETVRQRKDGSEFQVSLTLSPVLDAGGTLIGSSAILRDITEQKEADERLKGLQAELIHLSRWNTMGMMASTLAHELNQPLTASVNYVRAARRILDAEAGAPARAAEFLDKAVSETKLASGIIRSLREFIDKRETSRTPENLNKVVEEALALSQAGAPGAQIRLAVSLEPLLPPVLVDKIQIEQVLLNLIRNALDAMEQSPVREIAITTAPDEAGFVRVSLADSGPGIAPEIAAKLFQPFVTSKEKGMGIGLTICQSIIEAHGGRIWAESGNGAVFHFRLPAASRA